MSNQWQQFLAVRAEIEGRLHEPEESVEEWLDRMQTEAYEEGRKDEREASCVDELVAALKLMLEQFTKTPSTLKDSEARCKAHAVLTKLEQS